MAILSGLGMLGANGERAVQAYLEELAVSTGAIGVMIARNLDGRFLIESIQVTPQILREGDLVVLENAIDITSPESPETRGPGRIEADVIGFSPLRSLLLIPFSPVRESNLATVIFSNREINTPSSALVGLARGLEILIDCSLDYERQRRGFEDQLAILGDRAQRDPLTELLNRRGFLEMIQHESDRLARNPAPTSMLLFDLDDLKLVNDRDGHDVGDEYLKRFARQLKDNLRAMDIVGRLGGDEFAVIAPHTTRTQAEELSQRLHRIFDSRNTPVSIGVASLESGHSSLVSLLTLADQEMYADKASRKLAKENLSAPKSAIG